MISKIQSFIVGKISSKRYLPIQLDITNSCNLRCSHCYHPNHNNSGAIGLLDWKKIIDEYLELVDFMHYRPLIILGGGEPTISANFVPLANYIFSIRPDTYFVVISNGTRIKVEILNAVSQFKKKMIQISLDGPDPMRHDLIRGKGSFNSTLKGIELIRSYGIRFQILAVLSKRSSAWIRDFFELARIVNPENISFTRFIANGSGKSLTSSLEDRPLEPEELRAAFHEIIITSAEFDVKSHINSPLYNLVFPGLGRSGRYWEAIVVDHQGYFVASSRSRIRLEHFKTSTVKNFFLKNDLLDSLRNGKIKTCGDCLHLQVCGGDRNAAFAGTGNFLEKDPGCWINLEKK